MTKSEQKVAQYLNEAHATELGLTRVLQSQIAMTPRGTYRTGLESHLHETRDHADRVQHRLSELGAGSSPIQAVVGAAEGALGQMLALAKTPLDLVRGSGGEEKVLKNAKDACATEALEIATYTALERLARSLGDDRTAELAASIRSDEERMLDRVLQEIPKLTDAVLGAEVEGNRTYDPSTTGAAETVREAGETAAKAARGATSRGKRGARKARKVPGVARAEDQVKGAAASQDDLAISGYDGLTADQVVDKLSELSQIELAKVDSYERRNQSRTTVLSKITSLRGNEPWPGYDELSVADIESVLGEGDDARAKEVRTYERTRKNRAGVLKAAERSLTNA